MSSALLSEEEFKRRLAFWILDNRRTAFVPYSYSREDFPDLYRLPDFDYVHLKSFEDYYGDLITVLKSGIYRRDWETRNGYHPKKFEFYLILKTFIDSPEVEPFPMGYMILNEE